MNLGKVSKLAMELINGDRADAHGDFRVSFQNIANLWTSFLGTPVRADQVAIMMLLLKVARNRLNPKAVDNFVDMIGYAELAAALAQIIFSEKQDKTEETVTGVTDAGPVEEGTEK